MTSAQSSSHTTTGVPPASATTAAAAPSPPQSIVDGHSTRVDSYNTRAGKVLCVSDIRGEWHSRCTCIYSAVYGQEDCTPPLHSTFAPPIPRGANVLQLDKITLNSFIHVLGSYQLGYSPIGIHSRAFEKHPARSRHNAASWQYHIRTNRFNIDLSIPCVA